MLFNSIEFLIFFPTVVLLYFLLPFRARCIFLVCASYYFYMWLKPSYGALIAFVTLVDFTAARMMARTELRQRRLAWLAVSIAANLGLLFFFKYYGFFSGEANALASRLGLPRALPELGLILPIGISFHTFQGLAYTIDVYRGRQKAESSLSYFALYVSYFPQLVAGPIERPQNLLRQLKHRVRFDYERIKSGLQVMLWGITKKVLIADNLALIVDAVYRDPTACSGPQLLGATLCFAFQIYCDFSGYSDIAIGCARVLGVKLMLNFDRPYLAASLTEFWRRWHISLTTWFRDYVYFPLGGNRVRTSLWVRNILIVFLVSGLWHGARWTFIAWGALHGASFVILRLTARPRQRMAAALGLHQFPRTCRAASVVLTFSFVCLTWIFFRADNLSHAWYILTHLAGGWSAQLSPGWLPVILIAVLLVAELLQRTEDVRSLWAGRPKPVRWAMYYAMIFGTLLFGAMTYNNFIYFQF